MHYASICAIIKDEDNDVREWLNYHFAIGFEHILIYDNNSKNPLYKQISDYISSGLVTVINFPLTKSQQLSAYMSALDYWGKNTRWLAFIDTDEFIMPLGYDDIRDFLDDYTQFGGVGANWAMFGSGGHISRPKGGILENYTQCLGLDPHIKSIVQPAMTKMAKSAHHFIYKDGSFCVNEDGIPIFGFSTYPLANKIRINHYYYKSQQDFYEKIARGLVTQMKSGATRKIQDFYSHLETPAFEDKAILKFSPLVRQLSEMTPDEIISKVKNGLLNDPEKEISLVESLLNRGDIAGAYNKYKKISRYYEGLNPETLRPKIHDKPDQKERIFSYFRKSMLLGQSDEASLIACYHALADYYRENKQIETAKNIDEWLGQ